MVSDVSITTSTDGTPNPNQSSKLIFSSSDTKLRLSSKIESVEKYKFRLALSSIRLSPENTLKNILSTVTVESKNVSQPFKEKLNKVLL